MSPDIEEQLSRYLRNECSEDEAREVLAWAAQSDQNAETFARASMASGLTRELFEDGRVARPGALFPENSISQQGTRIHWPWAVAAALAFSLVGLALWSPFLSLPSNYAVITQSVGARLPDGSLFKVASEVGSETIELASGLLRLDFIHGTSMTIEAPARFSLRDAKHVFLEEGIATFQVPEQVTGFTVDTKEAEIIDLGTAFGLARRAAGQTEVCVFEGEVEVDGNLVLAGKSVFARQGSELQEQAFETAIYEKAWPVASGVLQTTGVMRFVSPGPGFFPGKFEDNEHITVFLERRSVRVLQAIHVDLADPGEYRRLRHKEEGPEIPAGALVRSYLLQLDPVGLLEKRNGDKPRLAGQITFDQPILGLIASGRKLLETDAILGHPSGDYGSLPRGLEPPKESLELAKSQGKDVLILAADQRTLILNMAAGSAVDQIRVLVTDNE